MRLREFEADDAAYYSPQEDNYDQLRLSDTRRPQITLQHLNQLKKMRAARTLENLVRRDILGIMYGTPAPEGGGAPGF
jgi:hypothetical protein